MGIAEKVLYPTDLVCALTLGLFAPLLFPKEAYARFSVIGALLGNNRFVVAIVVVLCAAASAGTMYIMVLVARQQPTIVRLLVKLFALGLPAIATGYIVSMALAYLGVYDATKGFFAFFGVGATLYLCAGIAGITAMHSLPEYKQILQGRTSCTAWLSSSHVQDVARSSADEAVREKKRDITDIDGNHTGSAASSD